MTGTGEMVDRRNFLFKTLFFLAGGLSVFGSLSRAFAFDKYPDISPLLPKISLIIDDIGFSYERARPFLDLAVPMTFSILPRLAHTRDLALEIHVRGQEIMLHQPMEPLDATVDPGPGALYVGDDQERIIRIIEENISDVPSAIGVNNHMGSKFTSCQKEMNEALKVIRDRELFFVDSRTSGHSRAYEIARRLQVAAAFRNFFLDNEADESAILTQLRMLKIHALHYGHAIGIGHPYPETARAIGAFLDSVKASGISFVHASQLMNS